VRNFQHVDASSTIKPLHPLANSRVAVVLLSWATLQPLSALRASSPEDSLLLQLTLVLELLASRRLRQSIPIFLSQEGSSDGGMAQRLESWSRELPSVVCAAVVEAATQVLCAAGLKPSERLPKRTVKETIKEVMLLKMEWAQVPNGKVHAHSAEKMERELTLAWTKRILGCVNDFQVQFRPVCLLRPLQLKSCSPSFGRPMSRMQGPFS
jgi:hypothetical protein